MPLLTLKFTKFFMPFLEPRVSFSSKFARSSVIFTQIRHIIKSFLDFWVFGWKFTKFLMHHSSMSWKMTLLYLFTWNFIGFLQKEPTKVQTFSLLTAQVKFHEIHTLISSFGWNYIKCHLKKYRGVIYISWYQRVMQNFKKSWFVVSKMIRI